MTKLDFEFQELESRLIPKLDETVEIIDRVVRKDSQIMIPSRFNSSRYKNAVAKLRRVSNGLKDVKSDLIKANKNFEQAEMNAKKHNAGFVYDLKVEAHNPIIELK